MAILVRSLPQSLKDMKGKEKEKNKRVVRMKDKWKVT